jgi:hypothetical protein
VLCKVCPAQHPGDWILGEERGMKMQVQSNCSCLTAISRMPLCRSHQRLLVRASRMLPDGTAESDAETNSGQERRDLDSRQ